MASASGGYAGGYAIFFLFGSPKIAIAAGLFWGALIFSFDRFIIMTIKKQGEPFYEFLQMLPRLLLPILISIVIAKPLEMKIFDGEITNEIQSMSADHSNDQKARLEQELGIKEIEKELELIFLTFPAILCTTHFRRMNPN